MLEKIFDIVYTFHKQYLLKFSERERKGNGDVNEKIH